MPNIAFTTLVFILLALPGFLVRVGYNTSKFARRLLPKSWTDDLIKAILYSLPFHAVWFWIFKELQWNYVFNHTLDAETGFRLLTGDFSVSSLPDQDHSLAHTAMSLYDNFPYIVGYSIVVPATAFLIGLGLSRLVWRYEWDVKYPALFGFKSQWIYTLMGRGKLFIPHECWILRKLGMASTQSVPHEKTLVVLDAVTDQETGIPGKTILYNGIVAGFTLDDNDLGVLKEIILVRCRRGKFTRQPYGHPKFTLEDIPGKEFILKYSSVKNMNLNYVPALD